MKIWITRDSAFSIQCGGLERLRVWFKKPKFFLIKLEEKDRDLPFDYIGIDEGIYSKYGWEVDGEVSFSFGKVFGYIKGENKELAIIVFNKLKEHFLNEDLEKWDILEKEGKSKIEDFLLEIEISPIKVESIKNL